MWPWIACAATRKTKNCCDSNKQSQLTLQLNLSPHSSIDTMEDPIAEKPTAPTCSSTNEVSKEVPLSTPTKTILKSGDHESSSIAKVTLPPKVITVDTSKGESEEKLTYAEAEGRTPKHANKAHSLEERTEPEGSEDYNSHESYYPPKSFGGGPTGAFQPHSRPSNHHAHSPRSRRYYSHYGPPPPYPPYDRGYPPYGRMYPPHQYAGGYESSWGPPPGPPPPGYHGRPPAYHGMPPAQYTHHPQSRGAAPTAGDGNFSRAVSSSFDRSVKSKNSDDKAAPPIDHPEQDVAPEYEQHPPPGDGGSVSDEGSWRQLNQIQSVDEDEMRKRIEKKTQSTTEKEKSTTSKPPHSTGSSLTNSPTEGLEKLEKKSTSLSTPTLPPPPKLTSSLDSLASVSSAQQPLKTPGDDTFMSPGDHSLDLMKCPSGTSALLLPSTAHGGPTVSSSIQGSNTAPSGTKRNHSKASESEGEKKGDDDDRQTKRSRTESVEAPPDDGAYTEAKAAADTSKESFYDKPLSYSYSLESLGGGPKDFPPLARPQSSASSTGTPMQIGSTVDRNNAPSRPSVTQLPSWELQVQDSFGGHSAGGGPLATSFSFTHDYHAPEHPSPGAPPPPPPPSTRYVDRSMESRNQSFEGGASYHGGNFGRADTMSFESRQGISDPRSGYVGPYVHHAPSWGSAGSFPAPSGYHGHPPPHHYRMMPPMMMRSFSHDSEHHRGPHFQPPSEFQAPPSNINRGRPRKETHLMATPFEQSKSGVFGWTKEEDMRLTEIMKKYKNPRDWEPIAKELNRDRSPKECHERWIRYLKPGVRKGQWTDQEDAIVMEAVTSSKEQPFTRWSDLAQRLPGRVGKQIRDRWVNHLNPNINHLPFSKEDDLLLWEGHQKVGKRWVEIATKFFKGSRSENHIKNRWYSASFKKFIANEFGPNAYHSKGGKATPQKNSKKKSTKRADDEDEPTFSVEA